MTEADFWNFQTVLLSVLVLLLGLARGGGGGGGWDVAEALGMLIGGGGGGEGKEGGVKFVLLGCFYRALRFLQDSTQTTPHDQRTISLLLAISLPKVC